MIRGMQKPECRELTDVELDAVSGGWGDYVYNPAKSDGHEHREPECDRPVAGAVGHLHRQPLNTIASTMSGKRFHCVSVTEVTAIDVRRPLRVRLGPRAVIAGCLRHP